MKQLLLKLINKVKEPFGLLLSGGIDSSVVAQACKLLNKRFTCYVTGLKDSYDIKRAERAAEIMNLKLLKVILTKNEVINNYKLILKLGVNGFVNQSIATVLYSALKAVKEKRVLTGQGADELFCGYKAFHDLLPDYESISKLRMEKLSQLGQDFNKRDLLIANHFNKELVNPFMNTEFINQAIKLSVKELVNADQRKLFLRKIGLSLGLPDELINQPKKAMQYGTGFNNVLRKFRKSLNT